MFSVGGLEQRQRVGGWQTLACGFNVLSIAGMSRPGCEISSIKNLRSRIPICVMSAHASVLS